MKEWVKHISGRAVSLEGVSDSMLAEYLVQLSLLSIKYFVIVFTIEDEVLCSEEFISD